MSGLELAQRGRPLACLLFGSAAWKAAARDQAIGWSAEQRRRRLSRVTNNTRFLLLPWVRGPHRASHLLAQVTARISSDWQRKYGHPIYLVETFVEGPRFAGTCYRAAGWLPVGLTTGHTRNDDGRKPRAARKAIYLKLLGADTLRLRVCYPQPNITPSGPVKMRIAVQGLPIR